ncbi:WD40 repeat-like protein [Dentipellis sp. KUC8613]|nr:WD40 repeat-like protein [Dentipellis sp. KUC8613]
MPKHARKRQRTEKSQKAQDEPLPLGAHVSVTDEASKDDEERKLESMLFGVPFVPSGKGKGKEIAVSDEEEEAEAEEDGAKEFEGLLDADLFFVDDRTSAKKQDTPYLDIDVGASDEEVSEPENGGPSGSENESEQEEADEASDASDAEDTAPATKPDPFNRPTTKSRKPPAWVDPDDATLEVSLATNTRLRKLRDAPTEDVVNGREYERRLRRQFEKINPAPEWATAARRKAKRQREGSDEEDEGIESLLASTGGIASTGKRRTLKSGTLEIERLRDANLAAKADGEIKVVQFHPSPNVPVLLTASADRRIRLFNIDGHTNPHLQTLHIPSLPVSNAQFHPSGSSVLLTGQRPFYYTYDLQSGATVRSPRGLWGTTFNDANRAVEDQSMETCAFNPTGEVLAVAGRRGYVHLVDWQSGAGQVVGSVKANATIKSLWWARGPGSERELMGLDEDAEVYVWDVGERRCVKRWKDDGGFGSRVLTGDRRGNYTAIGSRSGIVNVYGSDAATSSGPDRPKPLKAIGNLTTSISAARFNHDSQLLAIASNVKKDQMRLIHLPSLTAFSNWPTSSTPLGHVNSIDFSQGSDYVAVGNNRGRVLLYHLRHYEVA